MAMASRDDTDGLGFCSVLVGRRGPGAPDTEKKKEFLRGREHGWHLAGRWAPDGVEHGAQVQWSWRAAAACRISPFLFY
jgi:hypothetical protein